MPLYSYRCDCGGQFEERRAVGDRNLPARCRCGELALRHFEPGAIQIQTPEHFRHLQSDFLPAASDTEAWDARQGNSTAHAPRQQTLREAFDAVKQWR